MKVTQAQRKSYAKSGIALPNGKFPIPDRTHLALALKYAHSSDVPYDTVIAHIRRRAKALGVTLKSRSVTAAGPPKGRYGRSTSLKWPHLYDILRSKGYDKSKAAAISNSRVGVRKKGRINVLKAAEAHNPKVLARLAKAQKEGKHKTRKQLIASALPVGSRSYEFACHSKACAPPPAGTGGSKPGKATARRTFTPITKDQARGDSRPVSHEEFQRLAREGQKQLDAMATRSSPTTGLNENWNEIKASAYTEVTKSWGGATIDSHTGKALPQGADAYAITVKGTKLEVVSVHENATAAEFGAAMDRAKTAFGHVLEREDHYLGVFHDDENHRIDIDPVIVVTKRADVDTIGAATHAIGGAYNFKDGNGYWPPHVGE